MAAPKEDWQHERARVLAQARVVVVKVGSAVLTDANGLSMPDAVREAQAYTWETLNRAFRPGMGQYIPDRFFWVRPADDDSEN